MPLEHERAQAPIGGEQIERRTAPLPVPETLCQAGTEEHMQPRPSPPQRTEDGRVRPPLSRGRRSGKERRGETRAAGRPAGVGPGSKRDGRVHARPRPPEDYGESIVRRPKGERGGPVSSTHRAPLGTDGGRHGASLGPSPRLAPRQAAPPLPLTAPTAAANRHAARGALVS